MGSKGKFERLHEGSGLFTIDRQDSKLIEIQAQSIPSYILVLVRTLQITIGHTVNKIANV